jgi:hypothetical protein
MIHLKHNSHQSNFSQCERDYTGIIVLLTAKQSFIIFRKKTSNKSFERHVL